MDEVALVSTCLSIPISLFRSLVINANPHIKVTKFCTETTIPSPTPPDGSVVTDFLINKCGMAEKDVSFSLFLSAKLRCPTSLLDNRSKMQDNPSEVLSSHAEF